VGFCIKLENADFTYLKQKSTFLFITLDFLDKMGCLAYALGAWVAFLKQPDALPGRVPPKKLLLIHL
jgi:hypothetical protein